MAGLTPIHLRYQAATQFYTDPTQTTGRHWEYLKAPEGRWTFTIGVVAFTTSLFLGGKGSAHVYRAERSRLDNSSGKSSWDSFKEILGLGVAIASPLVLSVGLDLAVQHQLIEISWTHMMWKETKIHAQIDAIIKNVFEENAVWSQMPCPFSKFPIWMPMRTPSGIVLDESSINECIDPVTRQIKEIYNKRIPEPTTERTVPMVFETGALLQDKEMTIVLYKRFIFLLEQNHLTQIRADSPEAELVRQYISMLEKHITALYAQCEAEIMAEKNKAQAKAPREERGRIEQTFQQELLRFKELLGNFPLEEIDWNQSIDWMEIFNKRWMHRYHS